ncbi:hypothetical protein Lesp02_68210 [Lentzea sp. NBRC 105346]|nr:hypothetical protein Lesp02_68210 [Lentzea sp. NBRC 105346]
MVALALDSPEGATVTVSERLVFPVSTGITDGQALVLVRDGTTAWHLLRTCAHLRPDESIVVHDAMGGVGSLAVQLARSFGAGKVIATETSQLRRRRAVKLGADIAVEAGVEGLCERLVEANDGRQVDVVLDPGGMFSPSIDAVAPFGRVVCHGADRAESVELKRIHGGSRAVIGFWFAHCLERPEMIARALSELFGLTSAGRLRPLVDDDYSLTEPGR